MTEDRRLAGFEVPTPGTLFSLAGHNVVVTGASAGLGERMARVLAAAGARVALVGRRREVLEALASEIDGAVALAADLTDAKQADGVWARAEAELGPVTVLVNNAAHIAGGVRAESETREEIATTLEVNLVAAIRLGQAAFVSMRDSGGGSIINISSIVALAGIGRLPQATYAASKGGLLAITREWAAQWSRHGVRVNALVPGFFDSEMTHETLQVPKLRDWVESNTLLGRPGHPSDFDGAVLLLASSAGSYITGQSLVVDGGWTAH